MKVEVLGAGGGVAPGCDSISLLLDGKVLLDAGTGAFRIPLDVAAGIADVVLTHSHMDHTVALCFLADNHAGLGTMRVHCLEETANAVREGFFNDRIWPNMENIRVEGKPMVQFKRIEKMRRKMRVGKTALTPFPVDHPVPTLGYCLHGEKETLPVITDLWDASAETWKWLAKQKNIRRIVIETSFPDGLETVARASGHLTPAVLQQRVEEHLPADWEVLCCHIKPRSAKEVRRQIKNRLGKRVSILKQGAVLHL